MYKHESYNSEKWRFSLSGGKTEFIGTATLNKEFYEILVISCKKIDNCVEEIDDAGTMSSADNSVTI